MGIFDKKDKPDFSDVGSGAGSARAPGSPPAGSAADFSDVSSGSSSTAGTAGTAGGRKTYTVVSGDSLSKIARKFYGDAGQWKKIHAANADKVPNPDLIHPGQELAIPDA